MNDTAMTDEDTEVRIDVLDNDTDPDTEKAALRVSVLTQPLNGRARVESDRTITYTPNANFAGSDSFTYRVSDGSLSDDGSVTVTVEAVNDAPTFPSPPAARSVPEDAEADANVGAPVTATDIDNAMLTYRLSGADASSFDIDSDGQITVGMGVTFDAATKDEYAVTVTADDGSGDGNATATVEVTITVTAGPVRPIIIITGGGGGGGGGGGPSPSEVDFEWTVDRDIEELDGGNDRATGVWSDGTTLWVADNADGAGDTVYAYDRASGERLSEREFALHEANRAPRGFWSDRSVVWVSDSGRERLFAYDLATGERLEEREFALAAGNSDARGIWSDEETMWVLDGRTDALFAYALASGELLAEYALDSANDDPRGIWSDGVTIWVSDHGAKRLIAYRLPVLPDAETDPGEEDADDDARELERVSDEEFTELSKASNNSPRGIWSDGDVMYVADESDDRVYSYNMPDAIDARLASLTLSGVDIGAFSSSNTEYEAVVADGVTETTVEAEAMQRRTDVAIDPPDADVEADGHQVALQDLGEITVTVTSQDGSRTRVYRVQFPETGWDPARDAWPHCLRGAVSEGFSLVVYEGGSVEELVSCAESRDIVALYALHEGVYVSHILGAPDFVNAEFLELFPDGLPPITPLVAGSNGPPSADPFGDLDDGGQQPWPECLRGDIAAGFSLVVYEGGSVDELEACARSVDVTALYALSEGEFVSYILGAPDFVTQPFRDLFADGLPLMTDGSRRQYAPLPQRGLGSVRWTLVLVACACLGLFLATGRAEAQQPPGAPTIGSVTAGTNTLTVSWSAPAESGGTPITAYDLQYIRTDDDETDPANWTPLANVWTTGGTLQHVVGDLLDGLSYDLQVRARNSEGSGDWSDTHAASTNDHDFVTSRSSLVPLGSSLPGYIASGAGADADADTFRISVPPGGGYLWVYTTGEVDTNGVLAAGNRDILDRNEDGWLPHGVRNFSIRHSVGEGTYYFRVQGQRGSTGAYRVHARLVTLPGATAATAQTVTLGEPALGRIQLVRGLSEDNYFTFTLTATTDVAIMASGFVDVIGELRDSGQTVLGSENGSGFLGADGFLLRRSLPADTYYVRVRARAYNGAGPYVLLIDEAGDAGGSSSVAATPLPFGHPQVARISSDTEEDYYRFTLDAETYVRFLAQPLGDSFALEATLYDDQNTDLSAYTVDRADYARHGEPYAAGILEKLEAGTYTLRIKAPSGETGGPYLVFAQVDTDQAAIIAGCKATTDAQTNALTDPLSGCQWPVKNTNQYGGDGDDINIESVWAAGKLGAGVNIAIVDNGIHADHEDLVDNIVAARNHDYYGFGPDALATHGTQVAGLIAARDNDIGIRGVAPRASIYVYNLTADEDKIADNEADAMTRHMADTAVSNNSWSFPDDGDLHSPTAAWEEAVERGVTEGFGGKGVFYVWAAGNGGSEDNSNLDGRANFYAVTAACATGWRNRITDHSERGSNLWVCAPAGYSSELRVSPLVTTTTTGHRYTRNQGGTSAAAAIVSGVAALVRAENPDLTWRDVKLILAASASRNNPVHGKWEQGARKYRSTSASATGTATTTASAPSMPPRLSGSPPAGRLTCRPCRPCGRSRRRPARWTPRLKTRL